MGRIIKYWLVLGALATLTTLGLGALAFRQIDLTFVQFAVLVCAPLLQAIVLVWQSEQAGSAVTTIARAVLHHPLAQPVLLLDGLVLGAGIVGWDTHVIGLGADDSIQTRWTLIKSATAIAFCARAAWRAPKGQRLAVARQLIAPLMLILAIEPSTSWLVAGFARVHAVIGTRAEVLQRLAFYGPLFAMLIGLALRSAHNLDGRSRESAGLIHAAVAGAIAVGVTVVLACFNLPVVTQPWLGVATFAASAASTCMLLAAIFVATAATRSTTTST